MMPALEAYTSVFDQAVDKRLLLTASPPFLKVIEVIIPAIVCSSPLQLIGDL